MKEIILTQGYTTIVDDEDYEMLMKNKWYYHHGSAWRNQVAGEYECYAKKRLIKMSRVIMGDPEGMEVDHRNGNPLDNQKHNLRICTHGENLKNMHNVRGGSSRHKGVSYYKKGGDWEAYITVDYKRFNLGRWPNEDVAALAYNEAAKQFHGEYACLNTVES